jgi:heptosyltransferase II
MTNPGFDSQPRRLLVVKVNGMGDSVMIRSIVEHLRERRPDFEIGVLVGSATRELMTVNAHYESHLFNGFRAVTDTSRLLLGIRRRHYDTIINFEQNFLKLNLLLMTTGVRSRIGFALAPNIPRSGFLTHQLAFDRDKSMWECFIALARVVEPALPDGLTTIPPEPGMAARLSASGWWANNLANNHPVIAMHLGSYYMDFKRWPLERFVELAERIRARAPRSAIVLSGTPPEQSLIARFIGSFSGHAVDASSLGSVEHLSLVLSKCDLLVSNDTGVMHLGAAVGVPTVGLFGPVSPHQWGPVGPKATFVYNTRVDCSPCVDTYANIRPYECRNCDKARCMHDISVDSVIAAASRVVASNWLS